MFIHHLYLCADNAIDQFGHSYSLSQLDTDSGCRRLRRMIPDCCWLSTAKFMGHQYRHRIGCVAIPYMIWLFKHQRQSPYNIWFSHMS